MERLCNSCWDKPTIFSAGPLGQPCSCKASDSQRLLPLDARTDFELVGTVLDTVQQEGWARLKLHGALHKGDQLLAIIGSEHHLFHLGTMYASGMSLALAMAGWEVKLIAPVALPAGTKILRAA